MESIKPGDIVLHVETKAKPRLKVKYYWLVTEVKEELYGCCVAYQTGDTMTFIERPYIELITPKVSRLGEFPFGQTDAVNYVQSKLQAQIDLLETLKETEYDVEELPTRNY